MNFDRNTVIGFIVLAALFFGYFFYNRQEQAAYAKEKQRVDSINAARNPKVVDTTSKNTAAAANDTTQQPASSGDFPVATLGNEQVVVVENKLIRIGLTTRGGQPKWVELKNFKNMDSGHVKLADTDFDKISYRISTRNNTTAETKDLLFSGIDSLKNADGSSTYRFKLSAGDSAATRSIVHSYTIRPDDYMIDFDMEFQGADQLIDKNGISLNWTYQASQQESDLSFEKQNTQIGFVEDGEFDYFTVGNRSSIEYSKPVHWIGVRQRFFNTFLIAKDNFRSGRTDWTIPTDEKKAVVMTTSALNVDLKNSKASFNLFYGPADYHILRSYDIKMSKLVNLGQGIYQFVRPLNRFVVLPVWDFIKGFVGNYGWVIAFLTLFIRLLISPLSYKSYLSGAKMKALRPEIAALKEKHGGDQQAMSMEQMKLFREAGVNPLGGCIPALLQIPIFFALYSFFSSSVDLRGADFLWAKDLSAYDSIITFGDIPVVSFLLGNHLSLFTITAVITSLLISLYSMSMSPDQSNPVLKYMPYIFPIFLLFIFNRLPSALTWYYTVSNIVTLIIQFVIQNYIIDHNKILAQIEANRKKPKTKSKWQERLEQMQEQQKKMKEAQQRSKR